MNPGNGPADEVWHTYFSRHTPPGSAVRDTVLHLHNAKQHEQVVACIEAALVNGQSQPWMYEVLALSMDILERPREDVERVLLSGVDFSALSVPNMIYSAAYLTRFGRYDKALSLYRQAALLDPSHPEPYVLGLKLAQEQKNAEGVAWAAAGILSRAWTRDFETLHKEAEQAALDMESQLRKQGDAAGAMRLSETIATARQRDLEVEITWSGNADLDLSVEEPGGTVCSHQQPRTAGGGVMLHDGFGPKNSRERYLCPQGFAGDYRVKIRHIWGEVVGKRVVLKITRYQGTDREMTENLVLQLTETDKVVRLTLHRGRLKEPMPVSQAAEVTRPAARPLRLVQQVPPDGAEARQVRAQLQQARQVQFPQAPFNGPPVGAAAYQPVISTLSEGATLNAAALISADRRYVRLTLSPVFSTLTDVFTFSFINGGGNGAGTANGTGN